MDPIFYSLSKVSMNPSFRLPQGSIYLPKEIWQLIFYHFVQASQFCFKQLVSYGLVCSFFQSMCQEALSSVRNLSLLAHAMRSKKNAQIQDPITHVKLDNGLILSWLAVSEKGERYALAAKEAGDGEIYMIQGMTIQPLDIVAQLKNAIDLPRGTDFYYDPQQCHPLENGVLVVTCFCVSWWEKDQTGGFRYTASVSPFSSKASWEEIDKSRFGIYSWYHKGSRTLYVGHGDEGLFVVNLATKSSYYVKLTEILIDYDQETRIYDWSQYEDAFFLATGSYVTDNYQIFRAHCRVNALGTLQWHREEKPWIENNHVPALCFQMMHGPWFLFDNEGYLDVFDLRTGACAIEGKIHELNWPNLEKNIVFSDEYLFVFDTTYPLRIYENFSRCFSMTNFRAFHLLSQKECTKLFAYYLQNHLNSYYQMLSFSLTRERYENKEQLVIQVMGQTSQALAIVTTSFSIDIADYCS